MSVSVRTWAGGSKQVVYKWSNKEAAGSSSRPLRMAGGVWDNRRFESRVGQDLDRRCTAEKSTWSSDQAEAPAFGVSIAWHSEVCDFVVSICSHGPRWFLDTIVL